MTMHSSINGALGAIDHINMLARSNEAVRQQIGSMADRNKSVFSGSVKISLEPIEFTDASLGKYGGIESHPNMIVLSCLVAMVVVCCIAL